MKIESFEYELKARPAPRSQPSLRWAIVCFVLCGLVVTAALPAHLQASLSAEAAWIELLSALSLAVSGVIVCFFRPLRAWMHISLLAFLLAEREFDAKVLSDGSYLRIVIEWIDDVFLHNIAVAALLAVWLIYGLLRYTGPMLRESIRKRTNIPKILGLSLFLVIVSQLIELIAKSQGDFIFAHSTLHIWEELIEFYFAMSILFLALIGLRKHIARD